MKTIAVLMLALTVSASCAREKEFMAERSVSAQRKPLASPTNDVSRTTEFAVLASATIFGFGVPEGKEEPRGTDVAFVTLMSRPDALHSFVQLFECDNVYAKLYALSALQQLDRDMYNVLAAKVNRSQTVGSIDGCVIDETTVGEILAIVEQGGYGP